MKLNIEESVVNKYGEEIKLIKYKNCVNVIVEVPHVSKYKKVKYESYINGNVTTPYSRTVYGVGYLGKDFYGYKGVSKLKEYQDWRNMLKRCYCEKALQVNDTYIKVSVCDKWHNFSNFYIWHKENYYTIEDEVICLDKDIKNKNCNVYSPENCIFVPKVINNTFPKCDKARGSCPIGVSWLKYDKKYGVGVRKSRECYEWIGRFEDKYDAFMAYKKEKENHIRYMADKYKDVIPGMLYDALYSYEVEITD